MNNFATLITAQYLLSESFTLSFLYEDTKRNGTGYFKRPPTISALRMGSFTVFAVANICGVSTASI